MRPYRLSHVFLWLIPLGVAAVFAVAQLRGDNVAAVLVVTRDVGAFETLASADVAPAKRTADINDYVTHPVGRVTTRRLRAGAPVRSGDVAPTLPTGFGPEVSVMGIPASRAAVLGGALAAGDRVRLLVPVEPSGARGLEAVVLSVSRDRGGGDRPWALVVALRREDAQRFGSKLTAGNVSVLRDASN